VSLLETARAKAIEVLRACTHDRGFKAAAAYYPQVWARDSVITSLGALTTDDAKLIDAARATLVSLAEFQCPETGRIPNYVPIDKPEVQLPINEAFDSNLWYVIGHDALYAKTGDEAFVEKHIESLHAAIRWARFMDSNNDGLIECHECADWKDTWDNSYHNLNVNVLYVAALGAMESLEGAAGGDSTAYRHRRQLLIDRINANFWVGHPQEREKRYADHRPGHLRNNYATNSARQWISDFYFPHLPMKEAAPRRFDAMGNLGAILWDVAKPDQTERILNFIDERGVADPYPIRVTYPPVRPGDPDYHVYYDNRGYCTEHTGHNGGIWPFVGGFYVAALAKAGRHDDAKHHLTKLAELNEKRGRESFLRSTPQAVPEKDSRPLFSEWGFCEHHHGQTGRGIGAQHQAWSAGMFLYAHHGTRASSAM